MDAQRKKKEKEKEIDKIYADLERLLPQVYGSDRIIVRGEGNLCAKVLIVGYVPSGQEIIMKRPFAGVNGRYLKEFFRLLGGIEREDVYMTYLCKFRPCRISKDNTSTSRPPNKEETGLFLPFLYREIETVDPAVIIAFGNGVVGELVDGGSLAQFHGRPVALYLKKRPYTLFALMHPSGAAFSAKAREEYLADADRLSRYLIAKGIANPKQSTPPAK
ncbi:MAG TPA: uracil-DNA glycosylase family protein [Clostridia bacterium]|nr:uracil-DNA glycosylase family protein [Clostridia bacterium]